MVEWSATMRNPAVPGSNPSLVTFWICSWPSLVQILGHACKQPTAWLPPASWGFESCYVVFELLFVSKYLSVVPVNQQDKLSALSTINKPLNLS